LITNGTVTYERTVRPADFESKKASVSLSFTVEEDGSDPAVVTATVMGMAMAEVHSRLYSRPPVQQAAPVETAPAPEPSKKRAKAPPPPVEVPVVDPPSAPADTPTTDAITPQEPNAGVGFVDDPAAIGDPEEVVEGPPPVVVITDTDIRRAVERAVTEGKVSNKAIIGFITEFTGSPAKSMRTIGQEQRGDFLARLKKLYVNA